MTEPARSFQHYEVLRRDDGTAWELGRGAMGITYKAFDVNLCCEVALKVVSSALVENTEARERFVREARAAAALRHRNVASVFHLGNDGEHFFYAMEFINGETLDALVRRGGPLSVDNTLRVILQVARALAAAERQHLVHRDIKPANLMVTHEDADEETVVKVIDFGLARAAATASDAPPLTLGGFVGTPQYASPEQLEERPLDARSDLYSLGVTAWFLLTGRVPFTGPLATVCQLQLTQPPPWEQLPASVPTCVRGLLGHLLAKDPARRPQNAADLRAEIEACLDKVQGTERKRDLHLPALPPAPVPRASPTKRAAREWQSGTLLNGRYRLLREIGGNHGVHVYQARDESTEKRVAIKILPTAFAANSTERNRLAEEVRLVQAAPHPQLVKIQALEQSASPAAVFLVEEWLAGFTLRDLLAGRGGVLSVAESLDLLEQAAAAADHAARCRLEPLELALTDLRVCFLALTASTDEEAQVRALLPRHTAEWPDWSLKVHAFRIHQDPLALDTWAGGATLVPNARGDAGRGVTGQAVRSLATLVYELLGGASGALPSPAGNQPTRYAALPVLNEEANALVQQALSGASVCVDGWQFHEALVGAIGGEPARDEQRYPVANPEFLPRPEAAVTLVGLYDEPGGHGSVRENTLASEALIEDRGPKAAIPSDDESVLPFFHEAPLAEAGDVAGSAWDRLTLVSEKRAHPGRWLAGILGLVAVFVLVFVGVLAWLLQQTPAHAAVITPVKKRSSEPPVARTDHATPRPATPSPLAAMAHHETESTPTPAPTALARMENVPPPPLPARTASPPTVAPTPKDRSVLVRLESIPPGAQIRLGSEVLGTTPCRVRLPTGDPQLIARYQDWPETRQTVHLDGSETRASVEIRLMRPELVPGLATPASIPPDNRVRRLFAPTPRRAPSVEAPESVPRTTPALPASPPPGPSEPEVRPAQRVLTPFRVDEPAEPSSPPPNRQPFSAADPGEN